MTVAIKRSNNEMIFIDAVLQLQRQYSSSVSKNPIENGSSVTDHVTLENPIITVNGVVSDADFNLGRARISYEDGLEFNLENRDFINDNPIFNAPIIGGNKVNPLTKFLPQSVTQFIGDVPPSIEYSEDADRNDIETRLSTLVETTLLTIYATKEEITLLEFDGNRVNKAYFDCILTNISFNESPDSGMALYPNMTFEQITKVVLKTTTLPANVAAALKPKTASTSNKGKQSAEDGSKITSSGEDAHRESTEFTSTAYERSAVRNVSTSTGDFTLADSIKGVEYGN